MNMITNVVMSCAFFVLVMLSFANPVDAYTDAEHAIYLEVTRKRISDSKTLKRIGKKYGISVEQVKIITLKVMNEIYLDTDEDLTEPDDQETRVEKAVDELAHVEVKSLYVTGDLVAVTYLHTALALTDKDMIRMVTDNMPKVLEAIFGIPNINRAKITAYFTARDGDRKVAFVDCHITDFNIKKSVYKYDLTVYE